MEPSAQLWFLAWPGMTQEWELARWPDLEKPARLRWSAEAAVAAVAPEEPEPLDAGCQAEASDAHRWVATETLEEPGHRPAVEGVEPETAGAAAATSMQQSRRL